MPAGTGTITSAGSLTAETKVVVGTSAVAAGATITIPSSHTHVAITDDGASAANAVTLPAGTDGDLLLITNHDSEATTGEAIIPASYSLLLVFRGSAWSEFTISNFAGGAINGVTSFAAAADLDIGAHKLTAATLTATVDVEFANLVAADDIAADAIEASELADDSVASANIIADTIVAADIAADAIEASELADNSVASANIIADTIVASDIAADAIEASELADDSVASANIIDGTIAGADVSTSAALSVASLSATGDISTSGGYIRTQVTAAASAPASCTAGDVLVATSSDSICFCVGSNVWKCVAGSTWSP